MLAVCAVDRPHGHALKQGSDKSGKIGGIPVVGESPGSFKPPTQRVLLLDSQGDTLSMDRLTFHTTGRGRVDWHTAAPGVSLSKTLHCPAQDMVHNGKRLRLVESVMHDCNGSCQISCQSYFAGEKSVGRMYVESIFSTSLLACSDLITS
jgi:hypothetical protein